MTVCFPPLIKPDGRFSRIRLSEFHFSARDVLKPVIRFGLRLPRQRDLQLPDFIGRW